MAQKRVRPIVVDDNNASIQYRGAWESVRTNPNMVDPHNLPFLSTQRRTQTTGSVTYTFQGSSATMFGSVNLPAPNPNVRQMAPWSCFIDNKPVTAEYPSTQSGVNWPFCHAEGLNDNNVHTLTMSTVGGAFTDLALDQIQYVPSPTVAQVPGAALKLEFDDPLIHYEGKWELMKDMPGVSTSQNSAEMLINFYGSSITWMASTLAPSGKSISVASYSLDGKTPVNFLTTTPVATSHLYNQTIFRLENLDANSPHNLFVNFRGSSNETRLFLDYLIIENAKLASATATSVPTFSTLMPTMPGGGASDPGNSSSSSGSSGHSNMGAIIGGVIGGIVGLGLLLLLIFFLRRKKANRRSSRSSTGNNRAWADRFNFPAGDNKTREPFQLGTIPSPTSPSYPRLGDDEPKRSPTSPKYPFTTPKGATAENNPFEDFSPVSRPASSQK